MTLTFKFDYLGPNIATQNADVVLKNTNMSSKFDDVSDVTLAFRPK